MVKKMLNISKELQEMIEKVEKIVSISEISSEDIKKVIYFLEEIDEDNRILLKIIREKKRIDIDDLVEILKYYNIIKSDIPLSEKKNKILIKKGYITKNTFDLSKYWIPDEIHSIINRIKKIYE